MPNGLAAELRPEARQFQPRVRAPPQAVEYAALRRERDPLHGIVTDPLKPS
jgi:hypothetical protein